MVKIKVYLPQKNLLFLSLSVQTPDKGKKMKL